MACEVCISTEEYQKLISMEVDLTTIVGVIDLWFEKNGQLTPDDWAFFRGTLITYREGIK